MASHPKFDADIQTLQRWIHTFSDDTIRYEIIEQQPNQFIVQIISSDDFIIGDSGPHHDIQEVFQQAVKNARTMIQKIFKYYCHKKKTILENQNQNLSDSSKKTKTYVLPPLSDLVLIDIENVNIQLLPKYLKKPNFFVQGFVGKCYSGDISNFEYLVEIVDFAMSDSADHALTFWIAQKVLELKDYINRVRIWIITRDHFGSIVEHLLSKQGWTAKHMTKIPTEEMLIFTSENFLVDSENVGE